MDSVHIGVLVDKVFNTFEPKDGQCFHISGLLEAGLFFYVF